MKKMNRVELDPRSKELVENIRYMINCETNQLSNYDDNKFFDYQAKDLLTGCLTYLIITYNDPIPGSEEETIINAAKKEKPSITLYDVAIYLSGIDPRTGKRLEGNNVKGIENSQIGKQFEKMTNYLDDYVHHHKSQLESYQVVGEYVEAIGNKYLNLFNNAELTFKSISARAIEIINILKGTNMKKMNNVELKFLTNEAKEIYEGKLKPEKEQSAGYDLRIMDDITLKPNEVKLVGSGLSIYINDKNFAAKIFPRSGMGHKEGIVLGNLTGIIDADYQGEIKISLWNRSTEAKTLHKGDRVCQMIFEQVFHPDFLVVDSFSSETVRGEGGFGSSGKK